MAKEFQLPTLKEGFGEPSLLSPTKKEGCVGNPP